MILQEIPMRTTAFTLLASLLLAPLALAADKGNDAPPPLKVALFSGSAEYKSNDTLAALKKLLESTYNCTCTLNLVDDKGTQLTGSESLDTADVAVFFTRRVNLAPDQLDRVRKYVASGRGVVGIRTASHGFQTWLGFDPEVLGGSYNNHYGKDEPADVKLNDAAKDHPVLAGIKPFTTAAKLYKNPHLAADTTVLLRATNASGNTEPVAWTRNPDPPRHGRVFYTSLGAPSDFDNPTFQRLLLNAVAWTADKPVTKK
jgi:type 1 glutamine amidotransferase